MDGGSFTLNLCSVWCNKSLKDHSVTCSLVLYQLGSITLQANYTDYTTSPLGFSWPHLLYTPPYGETIPLSSLINGWASLYSPISPLWKHFLAVCPFWPQLQHVGGPFPLYCVLYCCTGACLPCSGSYTQYSSPYVGGRGL